MTESANAPQRQRWIVMGPGIFVTAAFIGPGTVMTASSSGAQFGYGLLWAVGFSVLATIVLQEMAARLGVVTGRGLAETLAEVSHHRAVRWGLIGLILGGILFGNAAYQTGNLLGAASGLKMLFAPAWQTDAPPSTSGAQTWPTTLGITFTVLAALALIWAGRFRLIQHVLTALVALMGLTFVVAAVMCGPDLAAIARGLNPVAFFQRDVSLDEMWLVIGLIGTTVVPYNLFLHASAAARCWAGEGDPRISVRQSLWDTVLSVALGGIITASLLITGAVAFGGKGGLEQVPDVALQLRPILGEWSDVVFGAGLFAAGFTSSVTAPIAAAWATAGCFRWSTDLKDLRLKGVATLVVIVGAVLGIRFGGSPKDAIIVAQVANGILLPVIVAFLLVMVNRSSLMGASRNGWLANALGLLVFLLTTMLSFRMLRPVATDLWQWLSS